VLRGLALRARQRQRTANGRMEADDPRSQRFAVTPRGVNDVKCVVNAEGALAAADAAGSTKFPGRELPLIGWNPLGELRLRMLRAASLSSHDRDMVKVSSSESVGEWRCAPPMAMGVDCEMRSAASEKPFIVIGLTIDGEVTGGAAGCGTGAFRAAAANAPEVTRTRILFSPCASFNLCQAGEPERHESLKSRLPSTRLSCHESGRCWLSPLAKMGGLHKRVYRRWLVWHRYLPVMYVHQLCARKARGRVCAIGIPFMQLRLLVGFERAKQLPNGMCGARLRAHLHLLRLKPCLQPVHLALQLKHELLVSQPRLSGRLRLAR